MAEIRRAMSDLRFGILGYRTSDIGLRSRAQHSVQNRCAGVEVQRVAELVLLRRAARLDAGGHLARVVAAEAALAERPEQIAQGAVAEEVEALVGDLEPVVFGIAHAAAAPVALGALAVDVGLAAEVSLRL